MLKPHPKLYVTAFYIFELSFILCSMFFLANQTWIGFNTYPMADITLMIVSKEGFPL